MLGHICAEANGELRPGPASRCRVCAPARLARANKRRNARPHRRVYLDPRWARTRRVVFRRDRYRCRHCDRHEPTGRGLVCDHKDPLPEILAAGRDPFDPAECQTLCASCSGVKDGGRGAAARRRRRPRAD